MSLEPQKVVLITGGSDGIGKATAIEFAKLGYKVAFTGRDPDKLTEVSKCLVEVSPSKSKSDIFSVKANFEDPLMVEHLIDATIRMFGSLDVLVNNAGYPGKARGLADSDFFTDFKNVLQVNLIAATRLSQLAAPHLIKTKGVIINISSIASQIATPTLSYSVSKAGLTMLTKTLANAFDGTGVRAVTISPGPIKTAIGRDRPQQGDSSERYKNFVPLQRVGEATEVAHLIVFVSSEKASYINGTEIEIDGGMLTKFGGVFSGYSKSLVQDSQGR